MNVTLETFQRAPKTANAKRVLFDIGFLCPDQRAPARDQASVLAKRTRTYGRFPYRPLGRLGNITVQVGEAKLKDHRYTIEPEPGLKLLDANPDRSEILLPRLDKKIISVAKRIAKDLKTDSFSNYAAFEQAFRAALNPSDIFSSEADLKACSWLCCLLATKSNTRPDDTLRTKFPTNFLQLDDDFPTKAKTLIRYILAEEHQCLTASSLEYAQGSLNDRLIKSGLASLAKKATSLDLLQMAYPGYLDGDYPRIRAHLIESGGKWDGAKQEEVSDFALLSARRILLEQEGVVKDGYYNPEFIRTTNWATVYNQSGLRPVFNKKLDILRGPLDALKYAIPAVIGINEGQIRPWDLSGSLIQWSQVDSSGKRSVAKEYIKLLTQAVVADAGCIDAESQQVNIARIKSIKDWRERFDREYYGAIQNSGFSVWQAFQMTYPELCGPEEDKLRESDFKVKSNWDNSTSTERFRTELAEVLYKLLECLKEKGLIRGHRAIFNPRREFSPFIVSDEAYKALGKVAAVNVKESKLTEAELNNLSFFVVPKNQLEKLAGNRLFSFSSVDFAKLGIKADDERKNKLQGLRLIAYNSSDLTSYPELNIYQLSFSDIKDHRTLRPIALGAKEVQDIKNLLLINRIQWDRPIVFSGLATPMKLIAGSSIHKAFELLFGEINPVTNCYGNTDISQEMVVNSNVAVAEARVRSTQVLSKEDLENKSDWNEARFQYNIRESVVNELNLHHQTNRSILTPTNLLGILKNALPSNTNGRGRSLLQKLLEAKKESGKYLFSETHLGAFLRLIRDKVLHLTNLPSDVIANMKEFVNKLYFWRPARHDVRTILLDAINFDKEAVNLFTPLGVLNKLTENLRKLAA